MKRRILFYSIFVLFAVLTTANASPLAGYDYLSPRPNSKFVAPASNILIRLSNVAPQEIVNLQSFVHVTNEQNHVYTGYTKIAADGQTVIFCPDTEFRPLATIHVQLAPATTSVPLPELKYNFFVSGVCEQSSLPVDVPLPAGEKSTAPAKTAAAQIMPNGVSVPSDFPYMEVTVHKNPHSDYIFLNNWSDLQPFNIIFDTEGNPVWYNRFSDRRRDFKVQKNGIITMLKRDGGERFVGFNNNFEEIATFTAKNGYSTDEHELQVLENGNYLLIGIKADIVDMSTFVEGGKENAQVYETVIQEFTPDNEMIYQWRAWDNFDITDMVSPEDPLTGSSIRFPHMNAIDIDLDGNILLSSRHISEVTKINRQTGEIIWRLGGKNNQFTFVNDPLDGIEMQHDIRIVGPNRYTIFDNGNLHTNSESRVPEYELDLEKMTATLVWEYRHDPLRYSHWMGNTQRLSNGNQHINWADGSLPKVTEVTPSGEKVLEMQFVQKYHSYRVHRCKWEGMVAVPYLIIESGPTEVTLLFNKFGDPNVDHYNIYAGTRRQPTELFASSKQTMIQLTEFPEPNTKYYFRVTAVDKNGQESDYSNEENVMVHIVKPGENMVINGQFNNSKRDWTCAVDSRAIAKWSVKDSVAQFAIERGGTKIEHIQLRQSGIPLFSGYNYVLSFDAWADEPRQIEAMVCLNKVPYTN
ncbi:aryl-sulfate sulfotransferase, partial [candidate division KSB1 bacterium]|nr:aryl-sulfate sulfotransferase [candidate division KSB1 bacterium]